jgi:hypothetical protein
MQDAEEPAKPEVTAIGMSAPIAVSTYSPFLAQPTSVKQEF